MIWAVLSHPAAQNVRSVVLCTERKTVDWTTAAMAIIKGKTSAVCTESQREGTMLGQVSLTCLVPILRLTQLCSEGVSFEQSEHPKEPPESQAMRRPS